MKLVGPISIKGAVGTLNIMAPASGVINFDGTGLGGGGMTSQTKTGTFTAVDNYRYNCDTSLTAFNCNLPVGVAGTTIELVDFDGTWGTNNLTVIPNGTEKINGVTGTLTCDVNNTKISLTYCDSTRGWQIDLGGNFSIGGAATSSVIQPTFKQEPVNLGSTAVYEKEVTITDTQVKATSRIIASMAAIATANNDADEVAMSNIVAFPGVCSDGSFKLTLMAIDGPISGIFLVNYAIG